MKHKVIAIAVFLTVIGLAFSACTKGGGAVGGGKSLNSAEALKEYLDKQPANSPDKPIKVAMSVNDMMIENVAEVIKNTDKYVSLDLSKSTGLTEIKERAFEEAKPLVNIIIPNGVIGERAFQSCPNLASVTIGNGVTSIEGRAFYDCESLTNVTIPNSVTSIGRDAFNGTAWLSNQAGLVYAGKIAYVYQGTMPANTSISLLDGTKIIADSAFKNCPGLISVTIPDSVTSIGRDAFYKCTSLNNVTIPDSVTSIEPWVFVDCTSLTSVTFQGTISSSGITSDAFFGIGDLRDKYLAGGIGTYTRTAPGNQMVTEKMGSGFNAFTMEVPIGRYSKWTKQ